MVDPSPLLCQHTGRYKGVYRHGRGWVARPLNPQGKLECLGTYETAEMAAQVVATYYLEVFGPDWPGLIRDRRRKAWVLRKIFRSSTLIVWVIELRYRGTAVKRITPVDIEEYGSLASYAWSVKGEGWVSEACALVALRTYRFMHRISSISPPDASASTQAHAG